MTSGAETYPHDALLKAMMSGASLPLSQIEFDAPEYDLPPAIDYGEFARRWDATKSARHDSTPTATPGTNSRTPGTGSELVPVSLNRSDFREDLMRRVADIIDGRTPESANLTVPEKMGLIRKMSDYSPAEWSGVKNGFTSRYPEFAIQLRRQLEARRSPGMLPERKLGVTATGADVEISDPRTGKTVTISNLTVGNRPQGVPTPGFQDDELRPRATGRQNKGDKEPRKRLSTAKFAGACAVTVMVAGLALPPLAQTAADSWPLVVGGAKFFIDPIHAGVTNFTPEPLRSILKAIKVL